MVATMKLRKLDGSLAVTLPKDVQHEERPDDFASLVQSSEDAIVRKTIDGTILAWNLGADVLSGYRADEVVGQPVSILVPPNRSDEIPGLLERLRRGESIKHYATIRMRKDGTFVDASVTLSPVKDAQGCIVGPWRSPAI